MRNEFFFGIANITNIIYSFISDALINGLAPDEAPGTCNPDLTSFWLSLTLGAGAFLLILFLLIRYSTVPLLFLLTWRTTVTLAYLLQDRDSTLSLIYFYLVRNNTLPLIFFFFIRHSTIPFIYFLLLSALAQYQSFCLRFA